MYEVEISYREFADEDIVELLKRIEIFFAEESSPQILDINIFENIQDGQWNAHVYYNALEE